MSQTGDESLEFSKTRKSDFEEQKVLVSYISEPPSLKSIAMVSIAVTLWGCPDWRLDWTWVPRDPYNKYSRHSVPIIEDGALKKLSKIYLPESLKNQVSNLIWPIGNEWSNIFWLKDLGEDYGDYCDLKQLYKDRGPLYWTMEGILDRTKVLKDITNIAKDLNNEEVDFMILYESVCVYCVEECISDLWSKLSSKYSYADHVGYNYKFHIVTYWTAFLNNKLPSLIRDLKKDDPDNIYNIDLGVTENMISSCIVAGRAVALRFFWPYLTDQEKDANIDKWIVLIMETLKKEYYIGYYSFGLSYEGEYTDSYSFFYQEYNEHTDIMCFLLSNTNSQTKQKEYLQYHAEIILQALLCHWPLQRYFLSTVFVLLELNFLHERAYNGIMAKIANLIIKRRTEVLLREIWNASALNLKKAFIHFLSEHALGIVQLLSVGDEETIYMILNTACTMRKEMIILSMINDSKFFEFVSTNKSAISSIDRLTAKYLSESHLYEFKQNMMRRHGKRLSRNWILTADFFVLDELLDWVSQSSGETWEFKQNYIDLMDVYGSLIHLENNDRVNDFLNWYFETEEEIFQFKKSLEH